LFNLAVITGVIEIIRHIKSKKGGDLPAAELLTLAVKKAHRGAGVATGLFQMLGELMRKQGVVSFKVLVGAGLPDATGFYESRGCKFNSAIFLHAHKNANVYVYDLNEKYTTGS